METIIFALSEILYPYKELVAKFAVVVTVLQLLTPVTLINSIRNAKTTDGFSIVPFIGGGIL
jgi:solute carrier family 50 (sugar transporter)